VLGRQLVRSNRQNRKPEEAHLVRTDDESHRRVDIPERDNHSGQDCSRRISGDAFDGSLIAALGLSTGREEVQNERKQDGAYGTN